MKLRVKIMESLQLLLLLQFIVPRAECLNDTTPELSTTWSTEWSHEAELNGTTAAVNETAVASMVISKSIQSMDHSTIANNQTTGHGSNTTLTTLTAHGYFASPALAKFSSTSSTPDPKTDLDVISIAIGISAGLLLLTVIAVIVVMIHRRKTKQRNAVTNAGSDPYEADCSAKRRSASLENLCGEPMLIAVTSYQGPLTPIGNTNEYENSPGQLSRPLTVEQLTKLVFDSHCPKTLGAEFERLPSGQTAPWSVGLQGVYIKKNRFRNILPFDHNRVALQPSPDDPCSDYINASFFSSQNRRFIATQGPLEHTVVDFWRMIAQHDVKAIVNLVGLFDHGKSVCYCYWPVEGTAPQYGRVTVSTISREEGALFSQLQMRYDDAETGRSGDVLLLHYEHWPDSDAAEVAPLLLLRERLRISTQPSDLVVVHCSAGVGRTGTYLAMEVLMDDGQREGKVDVLRRVSELRLTRPNMVQTPSQYVFLHRCLFEGLNGGNTRIPAEQLRAVLAAETALSDKQFKLQKQLNGRNPEGPISLLGFTPRPELLVTDSSQLPLLLANANEPFAAIMIFDEKANPNVAGAPVLRMTAWNASVPSSTTVVIELMNQLDAYIQQNPGRVLISCPDGVTRCGLMAAIIFLWRQFCHENAVDVFRIVRILRITRQEFINNQNQYKFLYQTAVAMQDALSPRGRERNHSKKM